MNLWSVEHFLAIFFITFGWVKQQRNSKPTQKRWQKWSRNVQLIRGSFGKEILLIKSILQRLFSILIEKWSVSKQEKSQRSLLSSNQLSTWAHKCHYRYERLPTNIESLVALLRKAELHPAVRNWTPGRLAANLIHKFRFDGIRYDRCVDTSTGALPLVLDLQSEVPKMALVWQFIEGKADFLSL